MKGSTINLQNRKAVPLFILKPMKKNLPKFPTPPHTQPKENVNETFKMYAEIFSMDVAFEYLKKMKEKKCMHA